MQQRPMPWREVLFVNGCLSLILGVMAYFAVHYHAREADAWIREHTPEKVKAAAELLVLLYLCYAVGMIILVLLSTFLPHRLRTKPPGRDSETAGSLKSPP